LFIGGAYAPAADGQTFDTVDPATGTVITQVALGGAVDVDRAVAAARAALEGPWAAFGPDKRQQCLMRLADLIVANGDELALLDVIDVGRTLMAAKFLIADSAELLRWYASRARSVRGETIENSRRGNPLTLTLREPVGVVGAITPWNAPLTMAIWKIGPVLATGCTVVHKPAEQSPLSALRFAELCLEAGIPEGVVNVVTGKGEAGAALSAHAGVDKISFTGSVETGRKIVQASAGNMKRLTMELGGKSPNIVFNDADLAKAIPGSANAIFLGSGQVCAAGSRLFVQRDIFDEVVAGVAELGRNLKIDDPALASTQMGPVASDEQLARIQSFLDEPEMSGFTAVAESGRLDMPGELAGGYYFKAGVYTGVDPSARLAREEIFGPILVATPFDTIDDVLPAANATEFGLAAGVWTRDIGNIVSLSRGIKAGNIWVNGYGGLDPAVPMGGYKLSGYGKDLGDGQIEEFLSTKAVVISS
jgi:aldehyde dehydrogenase (NAD+)